MAEKISGLIKIILLSALIITPTIMFGDDIEVEGMDIHSTIDWDKNQIVIDVSREIAGDLGSLPSRRYRAEQYIIDRLPLIVTKAVFPLMLDSWNSVQDKVSEFPLTIQQIKGLSQYTTRQYSHTSQNLEILSIRFTLNIYPHIVNIFFKSYGMEDLIPVLDFESTANFTGILIYAQGALPVHGKEETALVAPCFFPRIFDTKMNTILDNSIIDPMFIEKWGLVGYADSLENDSITRRVGDFPLKVMASGIFGKNNTDIIIPYEAARKILRNMNNHSLLREGKIVVIIGE